MRIAAHLLVRDEEDVIAEFLGHVAGFCDHILVLDTGSADATYEICRAHPKTAWAGRTGARYSDALRQILLEKSRGLLGPDDWFLALSADHFFSSDPREDVGKAAAEGAGVITYEVAQFYFTTRDLARSRAEPGWDRLPVVERLRHYCINHRGFPAAFRNVPGLGYDEEVAEWPSMPDPRVASFHPVLRHYQFRSPCQMRRRLAVRYSQRRLGFGGFRHYESPRWKRYVFAPELLHVFEGRWEYSKTPSLEDLLRTTEAWPARAWRAMGSLAQATPRGLPGAPARGREGLAWPPRAVAARNLLLLGSLREVLARANERGIPVVVLKGAALLCWLIEDPGERPMGDVDIMVPPGRRDETEAVLRNLGYERVSGTVEAFARGTVVIDLHTELVYRRDMGCVWAECVPILVEGERALSLDADETFIHIAARGILQGGCLEERHLDDLLRLAGTAGGGKSGLDWSRVARKASSLGLKPLLHAALAELRAAKGACPVPERVMAGLRPSGAGRVAAWAARRAASRRQESYLRSAVLFGLLRPGFLLRRLCPGREFLRRRYGESWKREALLRPFRLVARALGLGA